MQIHHIDENPRNHLLINLAVLCFDCHRETQIKGGFDRKLDAEQIILYRDDWMRIVAQQRAAVDLPEGTVPTDYSDVVLETSLAEIYRENGQYEFLAMHYNRIGNIELRDKYIEVVLSEEPGDELVIFYRKMQGRQDLIPDDVIERQRATLTKRKDWLQRARFWHSIGRGRESVEDYLRGIAKSLREERIFSAAFYLKELANSGLVEELFIAALKQAREGGDLWWQARALQELGWDEELDELVLTHSDEIDASPDLLLKELLAVARRDREMFIEMRKRIAKGETIRPDGIVEIIIDEEESA